MKAKKNIAVFMLIALLFTGAVNTFGITGQSLDKGSYSPNDVAKLTLTLDLNYQVNPGETFLYFRGIVVEVNSFSTYESYYIGNSDSSSTTLTIPIKIPEDAGSSIYAIPVKVSGTAVISSNGKTKTEFVSSQAIVALKVVKSPKISIRFMQGEVVEGQSSVIEICNYGGMAKEIEISLEGNFSLSNGKEYLEVLEGCITKNLSIETSLEGKQNIPFLLKYKDYVGDETTTVLYVPANINKGKTVFIINHRNNIYSGDESTIILNIKNLGNNAREVRIKPVKDVEFVGKSEVLIENIEKGGEKNIKETVYTELPPGVRSVEFNIKWKEKGKDKEEVISVPLNIISKDGIEVYLEAEPLPLRNGEEHSISIVVANKAKYEISSVSVSIDSAAFELLDLSNKKFIGTLQPDDFSSEQFRVRARREGEYNVKVNVSYRDTSGREMLKEFEIPVKVYGRESNDDNSWVLFLILLLISITVLWKKEKILEIIKKGKK